jgi:hypothetical protein
MSKQPEVSNLFLVRVWVEQTGDGLPEWRGKVQHVVSGEARPFHDCAALEAAMHDMLDMLQTYGGSEDAQGRDERGKYLHPTENGQPESKGIGYEEEHQTKSQQQSP